MRLTTIFLALLVALVGTTVYANGMGSTAQPTQEEEIAPPAGAGPMEEEPAATQPEPMPSEAPEAMPPVGAGPAMPPAAAGMMAMTPEVEAFNTNFVTMNFGVDRNSVMGLRQAGWQWGDIYLMAHIASRANQPILEVANLRSQGMAWNDIGGRFNMTAMDLTTPVTVRTRVAGFVTEVGFQPIYYRTDPWGNPVLTRYEAERLSRLGYRWENIAIAANVSAETGVAVRDVLSWIDRGYTWSQVAIQYGLDIDDITDISKYPFARERGAMAPMTSPPTGAGPMEPIGPIQTEEPVSPPVY